MATLVRVYDMVLYVKVTGKVKLADAGQAKGVGPLPPYLTATAALRRALIAAKKAELKKQTGWTHDLVPCLVPTRRYQVGDQVKAIHK